MKKDAAFMLLGILFLIVVQVCLLQLIVRITKQEVEEEYEVAIVALKEEYEQKLDVKQLALDIAIASHKECRTIVEELVPVFEPRPLRPE